MKNIKNNNNNKKKKTKKKLQVSNIGKARRLSGGNIRLKLNSCIKMTVVWEGVILNINVCDYIDKDNEVWKMRIRNVIATYITTKLSKETAFGQLLKNHLASGRRLRELFSYKLTAYR